MERRKLYMLVLAGMLFVSTATPAIRADEVGTTQAAMVTEETELQEADSLVAEAFAAAAAEEPAPSNDGGNEAAEQESPAAEDSGNEDTDASAQAEAQSQDVPTDSGVADENTESGNDESGSGNTDSGTDSTDGGEDTDSGTEPGSEGGESSVSDTDENPTDSGDTTDSGVDSGTDSTAEQTDSGENGNDESQQSQTDSTGSKKDTQTAKPSTGKKPSPAISGKTPDKHQAKPSATPTQAPAAPTQAPARTAEPQTSDFSAYVTGTGSYSGASGKGKIPVSPYANSLVSKLAPGMRDKMVAYAVQFITEVSGVPYVWGGESLETGVDCSGFTQQIYRAFGIELPRTSAEQAECGRVVEFKDAKKGDLLFKAKDGVVHHVMMVIDNDKKNRVITVVEAKGSQYGIVISTFDYDNPSLYTCNTYFESVDYPSTQASAIAQKAEKANGGDEKAQDEMLSQLKQMAMKAHDETGVPTSVIMARVITDGKWGVLPDKAVKSNNILRVKADVADAVNNGSDGGREDAESDDSPAETTENDENVVVDDAETKTENTENPYWNGDTITVDDSDMESNGEDSGSEDAADLLNVHGASADGGREDADDLRTRKNPLLENIKEEPAATESAQKSEYRVYEDVETAIADAISLEDAQYVVEGDSDVVMTAEDVIAAMKADEGAAEKADIIEGVIGEYDLTKYDASGAIIGAVDGSDYTDEEMELIWAVVAQEDDVSYEGALAVISTAMNRADVNYGGYGTTAMAQLTAEGQFCYSPSVSDPSLWQARLGGNVPDFVKEAVEACLKNGERNHEYLNFRSAQDASGSRVQIGSNYFF